MNRKGVEPFSQLIKTAAQTIWKVCVSTSLCVTAHCREPTRAHQQQSTQRGVSARTQVRANWINWYLVLV